MEDERDEGTGRRPQRQGRSRPQRRGGGGYWRRGMRRRCHFCAEGITNIDYKDTDLLRRFLSDRGKIRPRRQTGTCARHQRRLAGAIKRARHLALLPFVAERIRGA